nr:reverse transcriptase domain-containing protein [Tanacetum cinerariifolium]GFA21161.1 reverse transcriptase domain-containing protein [Tanacetum cinerariifolium]
MWEQKTKGTDVIGYSRHFQELALMCDRTFPEESNRVEKYIGGVPDMIHDSVKATKPKTKQEAIEFSTELLDKRIRDAIENKQKFEGTSGNNQNQPQQNKRQNTGRAYAAGNSDINMYTGPKPLCSKCDYHHEGPCPPRFNNCKRVGHLTRDCRSRPTNANNNNNNQKGNGFYECGAQGHFKRNCPKLKNNIRGNQGRNDNAQARVFVIGNTGANPDNVVVDHHYNVEIADGRIIGVNTIMRDFTLNFLNHPFNIDLLSVELGFPKIAKPMTKLTQKKVKFEWGDKQEAAFQLLKQKLCSAPILALPEGSEDFIVYCDASIKGLGAVLMQREK